MRKLPSLMTLALLLFIGYVSAQAKIIAYVGDFKIIKEEDPWEDKAVVYALTKYDGGFMEGASLVLHCDRDKTLLLIKTDFIISVPDLNPWVSVKYRIGKLKPEKADWMIADKGDLLFPATELGMEIIGTLIKQRSNQFLVGVEDAIGEFHTLKFSVNGIENLHKYLPCLNPNSF